MACTWVGRICRLILVRNGAVPTLEWWVIGSLAGPIPDRALFERCLLSLGTQPCSYNTHHNPPHDLSPPSPPHYTATSLHTFLDQSRTHCSLSILPTPSKLATLCTPLTQPRHLTIPDPGAKETSRYNTFFVSSDFRRGLSTTSTWTSFLFSRLL
jgi:hypothetical protein